MIGHPLRKRDVFALWSTELPHREADSEIYRRNDADHCEHEEKNQLTRCAARGVLVLEEVHVSLGDAIVRSESALRMRAKAVPQQKIRRRDAHLHSLASHR